MKTKFSLLAILLAAISLSGVRQATAEEEWHTLDESAYQVIIDKAAKDNIRNPRIEIQFLNSQISRYRFQLSYDSNSPTETVFNQYLNTLPYFAEREINTDISTVFSSGGGDKWINSATFQFEPFGTDSFNFVTFNRAGEYDVIPFEIQGLSDQDTDYPEYVVTSNSNLDVIVGDNQTYDILLSGDRLGGTAENEWVRKKRILLDESGQYLDSGPWVYSLEEATSSPNGETWTLSFGIETGFNKYVIQPYSPTGTATPPRFGKVTEITIQRLPDPDQPTEMATLTESTDIWFNEPTIDSPNDFENAAPYRTSFLGFMHDRPNNRLVYPFDIQGNGRDDFIYINDVAELWISMNRNDGVLETPYNAQNLFIHDDLENWTVLRGEFNKIYGEELLQINSDGTLSRSEAVYRTQDERFDFSAPPQSTQPSPFRYDPANGSNLFIADMTRDNRDDLIQVTNDDFGTIRMMEFQETKFADPITLGVTGFRHDPAAGFQVLFADVTGDDAADAIQIAYGEVWVAVAENNGRSLRDPERWGAPGFRGISQPSDNWWVYVTNGGPDNGPNLFQINEFGELWVSDLNYNETTQTGTAGPPIFVQANGFRHQELGNWQTYFGNFVD